MRLPKPFIPTLIALALASVLTALNSCSNGKTDSGPANGPASVASPAPSPKTGFEADLEYVRKGQYSYIWVFSRKDGKPLDANDGNFLRTNAPQVVDWIRTDEGKRFIAGTNFDLEKGNLELIKKRFTVEDYTSR